MNGRPRQDKQIFGFFVYKPYVCELHDHHVALLRHLSLHRCRTCPKCNSSEQSFPLEQLSAGKNIFFTLLHPTTTIHCSNLLAAAIFVLRFGQAFHPCSYPSSTGNGLEAKTAEESWILSRVPIHREVTSWLLMIFELSIENIKITVIQNDSTSQARVSKPLGRIPS